MSQSPEPPWEAVEVGVEEWFLGKPDEDGGYHPFHDLGCVDRELAHRIAACLNACRGIPTDRLAQVKSINCLLLEVAEHTKDYRIIDPYDD